jgi:hypothetical protein
MYRRGGGPGLGPGTPDFYIKLLLLLLEYLGVLNYVFISPREY